MRLPHEPDLHEPTDDAREQVAATWLEFFNAPR